MPIDQDIRDAVIDSFNRVSKDRISKEDIIYIEEEIHNLYGNNTKGYINRQKELIKFFSGDSDAVTEKIASGDYTPAQIAKIDFIEFKFPKKSKVDYKGLKDLDMKDNTKAVRNAVIIKLKGLYKNILDIPLSEVPMNLVNDIEKALFDKFGDDPQGYMVALTKILIFANPKNHIGQYANSFRDKLLQGVYSPERVIELDLTELLPEVFMNPKNDQTKLLEMHGSIDKAVMDATADTIADVNVTIDPTSKRTKVPVRDLSKLKKQIGKNQVDTHKICGNPYWNMKKVNTIICKQDQKFYCLDIEELLVQLAKGETAKNYFTDKELSGEINDNLQKVYGKEIEEISKNGGNKVSVGSRTMSELETLEQTLTELEYLADLMKDQDVVDAVAIFGLEFFEDNTELKRKDALESIPALTRSEFDDIISKNPERGATEFKDWLNDNIAVIRNILDKTNDIESDSEEVEIIEKETGDIVVPQYVIDREREAVFVKQHILGEDSVSKNIVDDYFSRLDNANKTAREQLNKTLGVEKRQEINETIREINLAIKQLRDSTKTIDGVIKVLTAFLKSVQTDIIDLGDDMSLEVTEDRKSLTVLINKVTEELEYVKELRDTFMST